MYTVIFKSGHALEQYPKIKFRVRQSVRWLQHIYPAGDFNMFFDSTLSAQGGSPITEMSQNVTKLIQKN